MPDKSADLVLGQGRIYTMNRRQPWASHVAVKGGRIVAVGDAASVAPFTGKNTRSVDLKGTMLMPGVVDVHAHLMMGGQAELFVCGRQVLLHATTTAQQLAVVVEPPIQPQVGGLPVMLRRIGQVDRATPAVLQATSDHVDRHRVTLAGSDSKPAQRQCRVFLHATAIEQQLGQGCLRIHVPQLRGMHDPAHIRTRVVRNFWLPTLHWRFSQADKTD